MRSAYALDDILFAETIPQSSSVNHIVDRSLARPLADLTHKHVVLSVEKEGSGRVISCGYWDNTIKIHALESGKEVASVQSGHNGAVTCLEMGCQGSHLVFTAGVDGTCRVWALESVGLQNACSDEKVARADRYIRDSGLTAAASSSNSNSINNTSSSSDACSCIHVLRSHNCPITSINYNPELDLVLTGDQSGTLCLHSARKGKFIRTLSHMRDHSVDLNLVASSGYLIAYSRASGRLTVCWVNGQVLGATTIPEEDKYATSLC